MISRLFSNISADVISPHSAEKLEKVSGVKPEFSEIVGDALPGVKCCMGVNGLDKGRTVLKGVGALTSNPSFFFASRIIIRKAVRFVVTRQRSGWITSII